jgi:hypothetical protein
MRISPSITIGGVQIRTDAAGRYCLNDLHKAAGGLKKDLPTYWLSSGKAKELVSELDSDTGKPASLRPLVARRSGPYELRGTYVVKELVYAYAMWISAHFHIKVIRAYDELVNGTKVGPGDHQSPTLQSEKKRPPRSEPRRPHSCTHTVHPQGS